MDSAIVHLRMILLYKSDDFRTSPDSWSVGMCCHRMDRTIVIERRIERHACADACSRNLSVLLNLRADCIPSEKCCSSVSVCLKPTFVYGVGDAIGVDGRARAFEIRIRAIEKLMPKAFATLESDESANMIAKLLKNFRTTRMILWQNIKNLACGEKCPAVGTSPEECRLLFP